MEPARPQLAVGNGAEVFSAPRVTSVVQRVVAFALLATIPSIALAERSSAPSGAARLDPYQLAARIDVLLAASWQREEITPAPPADPAEFLRRVHLDVVGRIPSVAEVRAFLADESADDEAHRHELVDRLLRRGAFAANFANVWRDLLTAGAPDAAAAQMGTPQLETWLRLRFTENVPYDQLVRDLLTTPIARPDDTAQATPVGPSPLAFYAASQNKPEQLAASASRIFLGVQVQCAQCHDHPFTDWKQQDFWSLAAFFQNLQSDTAVAAAPTIAVPDLNTTVSARFLGQREPTFEPGETARDALARWITSRDNPYFARAAANRVWHQFFGRGLVEPVDDLDPSNPPSHPEVFELLAEQFAAHDYDVKYLVRAITATRAYQLSSRSARVAHAPPHGDASDDAENGSSGDTNADAEVRSFARMPIRRMTGDQMFDSFVQATALHEDEMPISQLLFGENSARDDFRRKFADESLPSTQAATSILQSLSMMDGRLTADATAFDASETLVAVANAPFLDTADRVETLFLAALSRPPSSDELDEFCQYVDGGGPQQDAGAALADVFWALLNSAEFVVNH